MRKVSQLEHAKITIEEEMNQTLFPDQYLWMEEGERKDRSRNTPLPGMGARGMEVIKFTMA
jgi:hypothetical protein